MKKAISAAGRANRGFSRILRSVGDVRRLDLHLRRDLSQGGQGGRLDAKALVDHCCHAWNNLEAQPWTIMSLGLRLGARVLIRESWYKANWGGGCSSRRGAKIDQIVQRLHERDRFPLQAVGLP